jgi:hypothetical protein
MKKIMKAVVLLSFCLFLQSTIAASNEEASRECTLYLAPSTIPNAGYGVFAGVDFGEGECIGEPDLVIPVIDTYKNLPYRSQQQFASWLAYIWPAEPDAFYQASRASFPTIPSSMYKVDTGLNGATCLKFRNSDRERIHAFAPGIASLVNSSPDFVNIQSVKHGNQVSFVARDDMEAGTELFLHYGEIWHERFTELQMSETEYDSLEGYNANILPYMKLPTEEKKRRNFFKKPRKSLDVDDDEELENHAVDIASNGQMEMVKGFKSIVNKVLHNDKMRSTDVTDKQQEEYDEEDEEEYEEDEYGEENVPMRNVHWLEQHGMCIDNLSIGASQQRGRVPYGKGAIANVPIPKGNVIATAPLLAIKRDDLIIYEADETQQALRNVLNLDKVVGHEELLNYCFGHAESEVLFLPYSPVVNYINGGKEPNAKIQWPQGAPWLEVWLKMHPLDVLEQSGRIRMDYVALKDILPGEEIVIDFGQAWNEAHENHVKEHGDLNEFRHEIGVPDDFYPDEWKNEPVVYEIAMKPLQPGELEFMTWKHNGEQVCKNCYRVGLPSGFSQHFRDFADARGITKLYEKLLNNPILDNNEWTVFETNNEQWFAQQYEKKAWNFNMHYIAAWDEAARMSFIREGLGRAGFDMVLESLGTAFGLDNMTCFHVSFMGISEADDSFTHADVYANDEKGFNIIWPMITVEGSSPELDIISDNTNIVISVNYEYDVAYVMGDWGYHKTSPNHYDEKGQMRVVVGAYCSQIDKTNAKMLKHIYDGEDPAPFMDQFENPEIHWSTSGHSLPK